MKLTKTQRLIRVVQLLQAGRRYGVSQLARELAVSRRTVFRDVKTLVQSGVGVRLDPGSESYALDHATYLRPINLSLQEGLVLMLLTRKFASNRMMPWADAAVSAALKVESVLPENVREPCGELLDAIQVDDEQTSDAAAVGDVMLHLAQAQASRHKVRIHYDSLGERREIQTTLRPYRVYFRGRGWYVVGHSEMHREVRAFKLERIVRLSVLAHRFRLDPQFDLRKFYGNAWHMIRGRPRHHVEIHFSRKVAGNVDEVAWHPTQRTRRRSDGSLVFEVEVDGIEEISWWVLSYGDQAVVTEPAELRRLVTDHARNLVRYYEKNVNAPVPRS